MDWGGMMENSDDNFDGDDFGGYQEIFSIHGNRLVDELGRRVLMLVPLSIVSRTRDVIQIDLVEAGEGCGDPVDDGITILVTAEAIELRLPSIEWTKGSHGPERSSRFWKRIKIENIGEKEIYAWLIKAKQKRKSEYRTCKYCKKSTAPEYLYSKTVCERCAEKHLGVVF